MPVLDITSQLRSALRAAAHPLKPVVLIGDKGLSASVLQEIDRSLSAHGLIKVRAGGEDRGARDELLYQICGELSCAPVHHLGKIFVLYRPTENDPDGVALLKSRKKDDVTTLGVKTHRKPSEPHVPKRLAAVGKPAPTRTRAERTEREPGPLTARERYLGAEGKRTRPSMFEETGSKRGGARAETPRRKPAGLPSSLGAARKSASGDSRPARPAATTRTRSAFSLRAGAREAGATTGRSASGTRSSAPRDAQRTAAPSRKPRTSTKK